MKKTKVSMVVALCASLGAWLFAATSRNGDASDETRNAPIGGLPMSLVATRKAGQAELEVTFRNVGERDTLLSLGEMLGGGSKQIPSRVRFIMINAAGKKSELVIPQSRVRGSLEEYRVPLRAGSTYSLKFKLHELRLSKTYELASELKPGKYRVFAQLVGMGEKARNWGQKNIALMNYWKWAFQSNAATLEL